jgi:hypothetical protein
MTQRDNILQELRELQSSLVNAPVQNIYHVPGGYFEGLADQVLNRIKALEAENAAEELGYLSPLLNSLSKETPFTVPAGFFEGLAETVIESIKNDLQTPAEELEKLSPLLSGLKKEMPFSVPQGYFERLTKTVNIESAKPVTKVVSITAQKWFLYAAAAVVIGFVAITGFLLLNRNEPANTDPEAIVNKMMKKVSTEEIEEFTELADDGALAVIGTKNDEIKEVNDIKELIKDIPDEEIQQFLEDTQADEQSAANDDVLMN